MNTRRCRPWLVALVACGWSGCSSHSGGSDPLAAVSTTSAVVAGAALSPVGSFWRTVQGPQRHFAEPKLYELAPGRIVVTNRAGWFTDRREIVPRGNNESHSAWVIDLAAARDSRALVLTPDTLVRWFWREHTPAQLKQLPRFATDPPAGVDGYAWDAKKRAVILHYAGRTHRITLVQGHLP